MPPSRRRPALVWRNGLRGQWRTSVSLCSPRSPLSHSWERRGIRHPGLERGNERISEQIVWSSVPFARLHKKTKQQNSSQKAAFAALSCFAFYAGVRLPCTCRLLAILLWGAVLVAPLFYYVTRAFITSFSSSGLPSSGGLLFAAPSRAAVKSITFSGAESPMSGIRGFFSSLTGGVPS